LGEISSKEDDPPNHFGKGTMKEQMLDVFIPITANALLISLPIFLARLSLVKTTPLCKNQRKILISRGILIFQIFLYQKGVRVSIRKRYKERTENNLDLVKLHLK